MPKAKVEPRVSLVTKVEGTDDKAIVTDADVAGLEAALAPKVVTNPLGQSVTVIETADGVTSCECGEPAHVAHFHSDPEQTARNEQDRALDERAESAWHAHRLEQEVSIDIKPLTVTQEQLDAMTRQYDQHDHMVDAVKYGISMTRVEPRSFVPDEYPHADKPDDRKHSHYFKTVPCNQIDVYRVLAAFNVADPCIQHAVKKLLVAGGRGSKDISRDVGEAIDTLQRWQEMRAEEVA